ncbi:unnamed protein product [Protopolystoma xenopodis]|uniref:Uncharacterized protein n=1 Tax=Protopolystoma xenopodis TaxID=117903 RepID=A0A3S5BFK4_9PLAT|nr:unnamed protein product [Protopolystoma xenopodis]
MLLWNALSLSRYVFFIPILTTFPTSPSNQLSLSLSLSRFLSLAKPLLKLPHGRKIPSASLNGTRTYGQTQAHRSWDMSAQTYPFDGHT